MTPKQEEFAKAIVLGMNQSEAYRHAYDTKASAEVVAVDAFKVMENPKVALRVAELRAEGAEKAVITLESHLRSLAELRDEAQSARQFSAAIAAEIARGKASGVHVEKSEQTVTTKTLPSSVDEFV